MSHRVFVYGTLLGGGPNHRLLRRSRLVGEDTTADGFALHNLGPFPGMVRATAGHVRGEVYEVDDATLAALDRLECVFRSKPATHSGRCRPGIPDEAGHPFRDVGHRFRRTPADLKV